MADNDDRVEIDVTLFKGQPGEETIRLVLPEDWTFEESIIAKEISEGMLPDEVTQGMFMGDPQAWLAILRVSYRHAERDFPAKRIMGQKLSELTRELGEAIREASKGIPPTSPQENGSSDSSESPEQSAPAAPVSPRQE